MMKKDAKMMLSVVWMILGMTLFVLGLTDTIDSWWCGIGGGFLGVGIGQLYRFGRYRRDAVYREETDIRNTDERNRFLAGRAWVWAGTGYVILNGIGVIAFRVMGQHTLSQWAACNVCILITLYWIGYLLQRKKY